MKLRHVSLAALALFAGLCHQAQAQEQRRTYIVQLAGEPAATYAGGVAGLPATKPAAGSRFNFQADAVQAYVGYLSDKQRSVAALVGNAPVLANYTTVLNGFAASLTNAEVLQLRANPNVIDIQADEARSLVTISTPKFLGLSTPGGLWSQTVPGGLDKGEDVVIGMVDGGIWPENPAFADKVDGNGKPTHDASGSLAYGPPPASWSGSCASGAAFNPAVNCNHKLIGAQFFNAGFNSSGAVLHWTDFPNSPRDSVAGATGHGGHGTHTSSTSGGNSGNPVTLNGVLLGDASGIAPRARLAMYKVCWTFVNPAATDGTGSQNTCYTSDSVSAIDKAVQDGVNVLNFSISGSQTSVNDPVEQAFLRASNAGVFVAASAGNSGPANAVAHISPWLTTVAASTHDRFFQGDVTLGSGAKYSGASLNTTALPSSPMILSTDAMAATANLSDANLCFLNSNGLPTLDPNKTTGKIVVCTRGTNARVEKSLTVLNAGGVGMVLVDNGAGLVAETHSVPTVHVSAADGALIKTYAGGSGPTGSISKFSLGSIPAPIMASFSSRGPNMGDANVLKPDLTAPGVDVIAGVSSDLDQAGHDALVNGTLANIPYNFASYQGTSMSSPHVAGLGALLHQAHPTWSPAAIKSALMTSAYSTLDDGQAGLANGLLPWSQGAGHVNPNKATDPGLVFDNSNVDWIRYQCKVNKAAVIPASDCTTYGTLDETYNVNLPSITVGAVIGSTTVTRKVTNVGSSTATYTPTIVNPSGFTTTVSPSSLTLAAGASASFTVKLTAAGAVDNVWSYGSLTWNDGTHAVKMPVTARTGKPIGVVDAISASTTSGSRLLTVKTGFSGRMTANKGGLKPVTVGGVVSLVGGALTAAQLKAACSAGVDTASVKVYNVAVPAGTLVARFDLRNADVGTVGDDNDLGLLAPDGSFVYSGNDGSNESVQMVSPAAGNYKVCVTAYAGAPSMTHKLSSWVVTPADLGGSFNVLLPGQVYAGSTATVGIAWSGLAASGRYLGAVQYKDASSVVQAATVLSIETGAAPLAAPARDLSPKALAKLN